MVFYFPPLNLKHQLFLCLEPEAFGLQLPSINMWQVPNIGFQPEFLHIQIFLILT